MKQAKTIRVLLIDQLLHVSTINQFVRSKDALLLVILQIFQLIIMKKLKIVNQ